MISTKLLQDGFKILNKGGKDLNFIKINNSIMYLINYQSTDTAIIKIGDTNLKDIDYRIKSDINEIQKGLKFFKDNNSIVELTGNSLIFKSGRKGVSVEIEESEINLDLSNDYFKEFKFDFKDFKARVEAVIPLKAKDNSRPMINGIHFNENHIVALDGFKLAISIDKLTNNKLDSMTLTELTTDYLVDILKIIKNEKEIIIRTKEKQVEFIIGNLKLVSDLFEGSYFNYQDIIRKDFDDTTTINNVDIKKLLDDVKFIESMSDIGRIVNNKIKGYAKETVEGRNTNGKLKSVKSVDTDNIRNQVELPYTVEGEDIDISFNIRYMRELLNALRKLNDTTNLGFMRSLNPIFFRNENSIYLLLPVRI